jgi:hypothetical protein
MKNLDFIRANIGAKVIITGEGDLAMYHELRSAIFKQTPLTLTKLSKGGRAILTDDTGKIYSVPPKNVRLATEASHTQIAE